MPELETVVDRVLESRLRRLHTALPGRVQRYDSGSRCADVVPMIHATLPGSDDEQPDVVDELPVLMNVPVMFPRAGGARIEFDVHPGDTVLLIFAERDLGGWRATGERRVPDVPSLHPLSGAVALPGLSVTDAPEPALVMRVTSTAVEVGGSTDAAALASAVKLVFDALCNALPVATDGGAAIQAAVKTAWQTTLGSSAASSRLKVGG